MSTPTNREALRATGQFAFDALSGRMGVVMMTLAYGSLAVVLLAYVSTQVYTSSLIEDVGARKIEERKLQERISVTTADYARLASRTRVATYCEETLGMRPADAQTMTRVWATGVGRIRDDAELIASPIEIQSVLGSDIVGMSEVIRK